MSDYSLAGPWADHVHALAIIESNETSNLVGDGGRAFGILQQHPAFISQWYRNIDVSDTWDRAQIKAAASFLQHQVNAIGLDAAITAYNVGRAAYDGGVRNEAYLARWGEAFQKVRAIHA